MELLNIIIILAYRMKKNIFFIFSILILHECDAQSIKKKGIFGEGIITISEYYFPISDTAKMDTSNHLFMKMTYYIKGDKILRNDEQSELFFSNTDTVSSNSEVILSYLKTSMVHPSYLINWNTQETFTFYKCNGEIQVSLDSLINLTAEPFYRCILIPNFQTSIISKFEDEKFKIANKNCYSGYYRLNNDTVFFQYSKESFSVCSPLNNFFPGFKNNILSLRLPVRSDVKGAFQGYMLFIVDNITNKEINDNVFQLPKDIIIKHKVSWQDMYNPKTQ